MSVKCCGLFRGSIFCPDCGKPLEESEPLLELLKHCQHTTTTKKKSIKTVEKRIERAVIGEIDYLTKGDEKRLESHLRSFRKWKLWSEELASLLNGGAEKDSPLTETPP